MPELLTGLAKVAPSVPQLASSGRGAQVQARELAKTCRAISHRATTPSMEWIAMMELQPSAETVE